MDYRKLLDASQGASNNKYLMNIQYLPIDWKTYHTLARKVAATILSQKNQPNQIVAISRGGLTFGHILSDLLAIPVSTISIQSYTDIQTQGEVKITEPLKTPILNKHVVLVDDVADSGKTLQRAINHLNEFKPKSILTITLFYKKHSIIRPDIFAKQSNKWIIFPYEVAEMICLITKKMTREGKSKSQIQQLLEKLHYSPDEITFVRKYHLT